MVRRGEEGGERERGRERGREREREREMYMAMFCDHHMTTDFEPSSMLCMPVSAEGSKNIAVAVAFNKQGGKM